MIKQDGVDRHDVSTWSTAQQASLNQLLKSAANATCVTHYNTSDKTKAGVSIGGSGYNHESSLDTGAVGCESLFDTCNALSEYNATVNCTLNSAQNCQSNILCNALQINVVAEITGNNNTASISETSNQNLNASANYTNEFTNNFSNNTTQSLQSLISQFSSQLAQTEGFLGTPIGGGTVGQAPAQGAREFAQTAAAISNITQNAVSNQINNKQVTDVANQETINVTAMIDGNQNSLNVTQANTQTLQTREVTQNQINNTFSNTTSQVLTSQTKQGDEVKRTLGLILLVFFLMLAIVGAIVASVFVGKKAMHLFGKGKKLLAKKRAAAATAKKSTGQGGGASTSATASAPKVPAGPPPKKKSGTAKILGFL